VPILGIIENMSYFMCPHCQQRIHIFGKGGGKTVSDRFNVPFLGEIPLHSQIMEGSDVGKPVAISEIGSIETKAFTDVARTVAGRISIIATTMKENDKIGPSTPDQDDQGARTEPQSISQP
jgi:ATP-binding protein involved in chromosome partitioning